MSGIPVYTQSPISPAKASGTIPQTAAPQSSTSISATATTTASSTSSYPPAQPGSAAFPAPTSAAQQRYTPLQPTRTTKLVEGPAAPQPGAVPTPISRSTIPPPPKAGESYHPPRQTEVSVQPRAYPPQMSIPPPTSAYGVQPLTSSTTTSTSASILYPVGIPSADEPPRRSLEHPPGYHQNIHASELTNQQKRAQEANRSGFSTSDGAGDLDTEGVWNTAKKWAAQAGEKISEAEAEVWRRVTKE